MSDAYKLAREIGALVILDPAGPRDLYGEFHPGYWAVEKFAQNIPEHLSKKLLSLVPAMRLGTNSTEFTHQPDGTVAIHFSVDGKKFNETGKWV